MSRLFSRLILVPVLLLGLSQTACINNILNDLGVPLPGDQSVGRLRHAVAETAFTAYITGVLSYCADYSGLCNGIDGDIAANAVLARIITPDRLPVQSHQWFSGARIETCTGNINANMQQLIYIYLKTNEESSTSTSGATGVSVKKTKADLPGAVFFAAAAAENCFQE